MNHNMLIDELPRTVMISGAEVPIETNFRTGILFELMMQETPYSRYDSGCDGITPECRSCRFHRPYWKYQTCVFEECPYSKAPVSTRRCQRENAKEG